MLANIEPLGRVVFHNQHPTTDDSRSELLSGLQGQNKTVNPKFFYDSRGSALFEQITALREYYPTRTEQRIYRKYGHNMAQLCGQDCVLIEPGSGNCEKVRLLLDALKPSAYIPLDISADFLQDAAVALGRDYPWLAIHAICADFSQQWEMPGQLGQGKRIVFYPGSTIGNLEPQAAQSFLAGLHPHIGSDGGVLVGVDLHKDSEVLSRAYNDEQGITAAFNLNLLRNVNQLLDAKFDLANFTHHAFYNEQHQRIEMHLVSTERQSITANGTKIDFAAGESIHTENSYKYTVEGFAQLAAQAGYTSVAHWLDEDSLFSVHYLSPAQ